MATSSTSISGNPQSFIDFPTKLIHNQVDTFVQTDTGSPIGLFTEKNFQAFFCSNYPKCEKVAHDIFCDAFGYSQNDQVQTVAIADGCGLGATSQRASRLMIDEFFAKFQPSNNDGFFAKFKSTDKKVKEAAQYALETAQAAHLEMESRHDEYSNNNYYGGTTFLGGQIFTPTKGKRYFAGVNCGDCKLFHLQKNGKWVEQPKPADFNGEDTPVLRNASNSGGRFGPNREKKDKTERSFQFEVETGDMLILMSDGVHDNLNRGAKDDPILSTLQQFPQDENFGMAVMQEVLQYTAPHLQALEKGQNMKDSTVPGKPDHMTLLIVTVQR